MSVTVGSGGDSSYSVTFSPADHRALLSHVFPESMSDEATSKPDSESLGFHNLEEYIESNLSETYLDSTMSEEKGRLGPSVVQLDNETNIGGQVMVESNRLAVMGQASFSTIRANCCVYQGKWMYEVRLSTNGVMQLGWCTLSSNFSREKGVGDTEDSFAYDGARKKKWNCSSVAYGEAWLTEDIITCCLDCNAGKMSFFRNGVDMGDAYTMVPFGPGIAYFPAVSLSQGESVYLNFGGTPLSHPVDGYKPLQRPPTQDLVCAARLLSHLERLVPVAVEAQKDEVATCAVASAVPADIVRSRKASCWLISAHILGKLGRYLVNTYVVEDLFVKFLMKFCDTSSVSADQNYILCTLDLLWALLPTESMHTCVENTAMSLMTLYRFSPATNHLAHQRASICLLLALVKHTKTRMHLVNHIFFDNVQFPAVFQFKNMAVVVDNICEQHKDDDLDFCNLLSDGRDADKKCKTIESITPLMENIKKDVEQLEQFQVQIMCQLLRDDDSNNPLETSRSIVSQKLRDLAREQFQKQSVSGSDPTPNSSILLPLFHRLVTALRLTWPSVNSDQQLPSFDSLHIPTELFCFDRPEPMDGQRLGGLLAYVKKSCKEDISNMNSRVLDLKSGGSDLGAKRTFFVLKRAMEDPACRSRRLLKERCLMEAHSRAQQLASSADSSSAKCSSSAGDLGAGGSSSSSSTVSPGGSPSSPTPRTSSFGLINLMDLMDSLVVLFQSTVFKQLAKFAEVREFGLEYFNAYTSAVEKLSRCPPNRADIRSALEMSRDSFKRHLLDLRPHLAWSLSVIFSPGKAKDVFWLLRLLLATLREAGLHDDHLFKFLPELHVEACISAHLVLHNFFKPLLDLHEALPEWADTLIEVGQFLSRTYTEPRVSSRDLKDGLLHCMSCFACSTDCLAALEKMPAADAEHFARILLAPYESRPWAQTNWILVRFWKGCGFGFRQTPLPHLIVSSSRVMTHSLPEVARSDLERPLPSPHFQRVVQRLLEQEEELSSRFLDSLLSQMNWAFSEFVGAVQELQQSAPSRNLGSAGVDTRQLKMCSTCFEIAVGLLRVLEMVAALCSELFLDSESRPQAELFASRLFQLISQILNRMTAKSSLLDVLLASQPPGLESVDRLPLLAAAVGVLLRLVRTPAAARLLLNEPSFQLVALEKLMGEKEETEGDRCSLKDYCELSGEEVQQIEQLISVIRVEASRAQEVAEPVSDDDLCSICYANPLSAVFKPCGHQSCKSCITYQMMTKPECFFCKAVVKKVEDLKGNTIRCK